MSKMLGMERLGHPADTGTVAEGEETARWLNQLEVTGRGSLGIQLADVGLTVRQSEMGWASRHRANRPSLS